MAKSAPARSELLEREYEIGVSILIRAAIVLTVSLIVLWIFNSIVPQPVMTVAGGIGLCIAVILAAMGGWRMYKARSVPAGTVYCPYCNYPMELLATPTEGFDCEGCHRHVEYENGVMVPIRTVACIYCKTVHKLSVKVTHYTCDRCHRALRLGDARDPRIAAEEAAMQNYDVVLTEVGRQRNEVAMALESILICNLVEARRQMENLPLTIMRNVPERKADAVRRRLRDLGATAIIRPTETVEQERPRRTRAR